MALTHKAPLGVLITSKQTENKALNYSSHLNRRSNSTLARLILAVLSFVVLYPPAVFAAGPFGDRHFCLEIIMRKYISLFPCALLWGLRSAIFVVALFAIPQSAFGIGQVKTEFHPMANFENIDIINTAKDVRGPTLLRRQLALVGSPLRYGGNSVGAWSEHGLGISKQDKAILHRFRLVFPRACFINTFAG
jgi:hypothetical protein